MLALLLKARARGAAATTRRSAGEEEEVYRRPRLPKLALWGCALLLEGVLSRTGAAWSKIG